MSQKPTEDTTETVNPEHEKLLETLKFTPREYTVRLWGYGGEHVMGTVDRKVYDYFRKHRLSVPDCAWGSDDPVNYEELPEDMMPFTPGSYYDCSDVGQAYGVNMNAGTLQVEDENGKVVYERSLDSLDGCDVQLSTDEEVWIDSQPPGTVVFYGYTSDKGEFFEGKINLQTPFDPEKLQLSICDIDSEEIVTSVYYDDEEVENYGGNTNGKGSDFAFYIAGSNKGDGKGYQRYRDMDDIKYGLTDWFPAKISPVLEGKYEIETKDGHTYQAMWDGSIWHNEWDPDKKDPLKIKRWRGVAYDPDEQFLRDELEQIYLEANE